MTRAGARPLRRIVQSDSYGELVVEITGGSCRIRQLGTRQPIATVTWGAIYQHGVQADVEARRREMRNGARRRAR